MRKLVVNTFMTLDGIMRAPGGPDADSNGGFEHGGWAWGYWDDVVDETMHASMADPFDLLLGRKTYEIFAAHWAHSEEPAAAPLNNATKYVASTTLKSVDWQNSQLLEGPLADAVNAVKVAGRSRAGPDLRRPRTDGHKPRPSRVARGARRLPGRRHPHGQLDRLARSLPDVRGILDDLTRRSVKLSLSGSVHDPTDPVGRLLSNVLAMVAEFEADEGCQAKGRLRRKQPKLNPRQEGPPRRPTPRWRAQHRRAWRPLRRRAVDRLPRHRT